MYKTTLLKKVNHILVIYLLVSFINVNQSFGQCTETASTFLGVRTIGSGEVICVQDATALSGSTVTVASGGTLSVCGDVNAVLDFGTTISIINGGKLIMSSGSSIELSGGTISIYGENAIEYQGDSSCYAQINSNNGIFTIAFNGVGISSSSNIYINNYTAGAGFNLGSANIGLAPLPLCSTATDCYGDPFATLSVTATAAPDTICEGGSTYLSATSIGGTGTLSYSWTSNPIGFTSSAEDPGAVSPTSTTTYTVTVTDDMGTLGDTSDDLVTSDSVTVTVSIPPNAGTNGALTVCQGTDPTDAELFAELGGGPDTGGTWSNLGLVYTYTVSGGSNCPPDNATVTVTEETPANAGTSGALTVCQGTDPTDAELFAVLGDGTDEGGTWTNVGLVYTYTVTGTAACPGASTDVVVSEQTAPSAGTNGTFQIESGETFTYVDLFNALGGSPDAGGTWTPALSGAGVYTYSVSSISPCSGSDSATITVTEQTSSILSVTATAAPDTICEGGTTDLSATSIGGTGNLSYSWTSNPVGFASSAENPGAVSPTSTTTYTVTVTDDMGTPADPSDDVITSDSVTVSVASLPVAPLLSSNSSVCSGDDAIFTITGTGGDVVTYSGAANGTATIGAGGTVDLTVSGVTSDTTITLDDVANANCNLAISVSETVTVNALTIPTFAAVADVCVDDEAKILGNLPTTSTNSITGSWALTADNGSSRDYTFTPDAGQCANLATLTVYIFDCSGSANAGTDGTLTICEGETITEAQLFSSLGGAPDTGGTWSPTPGAQGSYTYTVGNPSDSATVTITEQTPTIIINTAPACSADLSTYFLEVTVSSGATVTSQLANSVTNIFGDTWTIVSDVGTDITIVATNTLTTCVDSIGVTAPNCNCPVIDAPTASGIFECESSPIQTLTAVATVPAGSSVVWYDAASGGNVVASPTLNTVGVITYYAESLDDTTGCVSTSRTAVTLEIMAVPNAGTTNSPVTFCSSDITSGQTFDLFDLLEGEDSGGTWIDDNASGALIGNLVDLSALPIGTYNFTYTVIDPATACSGSSTITVVKQIGPPPGINASINVCNENLISAAELFAALGNTTIAGGTWSPTIAGADTYTYSLGNGFCGDTYRVAVTFNDATSCVPDVDVIIRIEAPEVIIPGQTVTITIYYSATTTRQIQLFLEFLSNAKNTSAKSSANENWVHEDLRTVEAGRGSYTVSFTVPELANSVDSYRWGSYMTTEGGGTDGMIGSMTTVDNVDVDDTLSLSDVELNNSFSIYPNPTQTIFNIQAPEAGTVDLMSLNGKVIMSTEVTSTGNTTLNVENLNAGVYFCRYTNSKTVKTMKLIKM